MASADDSPPRDRVPPTRWTSLESANYVAFGQAVNRDLTGLGHLQKKYRRVRLADFRKLIEELLKVANAGTPSSAYPRGKRAAAIHMPIGQADPRAAAAALWVDLEAVREKREAFNRAKRLIANRLEPDLRLPIEPDARSRYGSAKIWYRADEVRELQGAYESEKSAPAPFGPTN